MASRQRAKSGVPLLALMGEDVLFGKVFDFYDNHCEWLKDNREER